MIIYSQANPLKTPLEGLDLCHGVIEVYLAVRGPFVPSRYYKPSGTPVNSKQDVFKFSYLWSSFVCLIR